MNKEDIVLVLMRDKARLSGYLYAIVRESALAEDLFQEIVIVAMKKHEQILDPDHLKLWARRAARFEALKALRERRRDPAALDDALLDLLEPVWEEAEPTGVALQTDRLRHCMDRLSPKAREMLELKYYRSLDGAAIAGALKVKLHSVYVSLSRIHRALSDCLAKGRPEATHA